MRKIVICMLALMMIASGGFLLSLDETEAVDAYTWSATMIPETVFSGDNATFMINGIPATFVEVYITNSENTTVVQDFFGMDSLGIAQYVWTVPFEAVQGLYVADFFWNDQLVAEVNFVVIYDVDLWQNWYLSQLEIKNEQTEQLLRFYAKQVNELHEQRESIYILSCVSAFLGITSTVLLGYFLMPVLEYYWGQRAHRTGGQQWLYSAIHPPERGQFSPYREDVEMRMDEERAKRESKREGKKNISDQWTLLRSNPNNPYGMDIYEAKIKDIDEMAFRINPCEPDAVKKIRKLELEGGEIMMKNRVKRQRPEPKPEEIFDEQKVEAKRSFFKRFRRDKEVKE